MLHIICAYSLALLTTCAYSEETLLVANVMPFICIEDGVTKGVLYEIVHEAALRVGHSGTVNPMPTRRQAELARRNADTLTTLLYTESRQAEYTWLFKLLDDRIVLVANADAGVDISSVEAARNLRIGVVLGGAAEYAANRLGFSNIQSVASVESNVRKLAIGRIDAWVVGYGTMLYAQSHFKEHSAWKFGAVLGDYSIYFGGPRHMNPERVKIWRQAFESMRRDGNYARILRAYNYSIPDAGGVPAN
ncbi:substrate-binding periplasmic protein [Rugamonas apoptosis]|uniref:Transporter substrate-binding domain-containing protein n=1 Tax=Rugamonas apoptosis TaxID=2758570 RepID=A0A7W2FBX1_9BURK|nr:transporter substrate-binding domain-containing protein [Rugamonas apoptosis]MBA5688885.1 transporter substrate-binding domain-containing protein [Rugamonas apoptosis]